MGGDMTTLENGITASMLQAYGLLSKSSARKKVYSQKAMQEGRTDAGLLLRAISKSESVQARRLLYSATGHIDTSHEYIATIFEKEIAAVIEEHSNLLQEAEKKDLTGAMHMLAQLLAAEKRTRSFYSKTKKDLTVGPHEEYNVCNFCGYINTGNLPETCPVCRAHQKAFKKVL
jgi:rubrerythrin